MMNALAHLAQLSTLVSFNIVIGCLLYGGLIDLIARLTEEKPSIVFAGIPVAVLVALSSLIVWTLATM